jgi:putative MATE family efflux protein
MRRILEWLAVRLGRSDREILALAVPALGALAAEPLYLLTDTAIVGHLGTRQLAALALAATILGTVVSLCIFLTYGTTARVARLHGAGRDGDAAALGPQALWLALGLGVVIAAALVALAGPLTSALGGGPGEVPALAARYVRLSAAGIPCALLALAGQGWLRGMGDLRTPLVIVLAGNVVNAVLEVLLVYGFGWGLDGSAAGTVLAQLAMGAGFAVLLLRTPGVDRRPHRAAIRSLTTIGAQIFIRTASLLACFLAASAVAARAGAPALAAHQVAYGLFMFLALTLDALAIAGQVLVGRALGAGDAAGARAAGRRIVAWSLGLGALLAVALLALGGVLPRLFTGDGAVLHQASEMWPLFAALWPPAAIVFALDGILIGASDTRYLAVAMATSAAVYLPLVVAAGALGWGLRGVWAALLVLMGARLVTTAVRFAGRRWALVGAPA